MVNDNTDNDAALVTRLYDEYYKVLVGYSLQITESREESEDIVQSVFGKIWEQPLAVREMTSLKAYLYNSVRNKSINSLRRRKVESAYIQYVVDRYQEYKAVGNEDGAFFSEEVYKELYRKIDQLPYRQRQVFLLCMEGKSYKEIGEALQISRETVKVQKRKAIVKLKEALGDKSFILFLLLLQS